MFLPKGQRYQEENVCLIYHHETMAKTLSVLERLGRELRGPVQVQVM